MSKTNGISAIQSQCVPLPMEDIDTDQIIPARFLKATTREGFGGNLFRDWRFDGDGNSKKDFVLNDPTYAGQILVAGKNFGCGSSREHAAWAILDYGFTAVVSSFFADIFKNNSYVNHLLPVQVSEEFLQQIFTAIKKNPKTQLTIDIPQHTITIVDTKQTESFPLDPYRTMCFENGYDDIDYLVSLQKQIKKFEKNRSNDYSLI